MLLLMLFKAAIITTMDQMPTYNVKGVTCTQIYGHFSIFQLIFLFFTAFLQFSFTLTALISKAAKESDIC